RDQCWTESASEHTHLMAGDVADFNRMLCVFGVLGWYFIGDPLLLLSERLACRQRKRRAEERDSAYGECCESVHVSILPCGSWAGCGLSDCRPGECTGVFSRSNWPGPLSLRRQKLRLAYSQRTATLVQRLRELG